MLDLDAIEARAEYKLTHLEGQGISLRDITWTLQDVLNLLAELRAAREVVEAAQANADTWDEHYHQRPVDRNLVVALAAYRAVVGASR